MFPVKTGALCKALTYDPANLRTHRTRQGLKLSSEGHTFGWHDSIRIAALIGLRRCGVETMSAISSINDVFDKIQALRQPEIVLEHEIAPDLGWLMVSPGSMTYDNFHKTEDEVDFPTETGFTVTAGVWSFGEVVDYMRTDWTGDANVTINLGGLARRLFALLIRA